VVNKIHTPKQPPKVVLRTLDRVVEYFPKSGHIIWIEPPGTKMKSGNIAGSHDSEGYINIKLTVNGVRYSMKAHHVAYYKMRGKWPPREMDHKRGNQSDNRWCKLRLATRTQAQRNRGIRKDNTTGYTGITMRNSKYVAYIIVRRKYIYLGTFVTLYEALSARRYAEKRYFGKFRYRK
jgi:hypothetical protein